MSIKFPNLKRFFSLFLAAVIAVADQHDPLGQIAPGLDGSAHNLLKGFQRILHLDGAS